MSSWLSSPAEPRSVLVPWPATPSLGTLICIEQIWHGTECQLTHDFLGLLGSLKHVLQML